jgi:exodeoxyribonuclease VII small subunit
MENIKFEDALKRLEEIVHELESGSQSLDEALNKYEEGIQLSNVCAKQLEAAKNKIEILMRAEDGSVAIQPFNE